MLTCVKLAIYISFGYFCENIRYIMNKRLEQFLKAENISQSQFADSIGVARASVSHILAGRNKPGFDFIQNMARQYPTLNLDWLITGKGKMFNSGAVPATLFDDDNTPKTDSAAQTAEKPQNPQTEKKSSDRLQPEAITGDIPIQLPGSKRNVSKIIIFFDDNTYQELK